MVGLVAAAALSGPAIPEHESSRGRKIHPHPLQSNRKPQATTAAAPRLATLGLETSDPRCFGWRTLSAGQSVSAVDVPTASPSELKEQLEAQRRGIPFLVYRDGEGAQRIVRLAVASRRLTVGRRETNDVALSWDPHVSRVHAELERVGQEWTVIDEGLSRNGSYVNGGRVIGRRRLSVAAVKAHLRALFAKFKVGDLPHNQKRLKLVAEAFRTGALSHDDL